VHHQDVGRDRRGVPVQQATAVKLGLT
jgi:hypothetical protein